MAAILLSTVLLLYVGLQQLIYRQLQQDFAAAEQKTPKIYIH